MSSLVWRTSTKKISAGRLCISNHCQQLLGSAVVTLAFRRFGCFASRARSCLVERCWGTIVGELGKRRLRVFRPSEGTFPADMTSLEGVSFRVGVGVGVHTCVSFTFFVQLVTSERCQRLGYFSSRIA